MDINKLIIESGITKASIARELGVSPQQFNNAIHGKRPIPIKWVIPVCRILGCDPNTLFEWEGEGMKYLSDDYTKLVVLDTDTGKEIAAVTNEEITTAGENIVVKLTPTYD